MRVDPITAGAALLEELPPSEHVFDVASVNVTASPGAFGGLDGVAVLTSDRLVIVPGAPLAKQRSGDPITRALSDLWAGVRPALLEAFPLARVLSEPRHRKSSQLASRSRPGVEIPLAAVRRAFEARVPGWVGLELSLPSPDPRPPFAIYLRIDGQLPGAHREWARRIDSLRHTASQRPEIERTYALFYLLRPPPRPRVIVRAADGSARRGTLGLHLDGPSLAPRGLAHREDVLFAYESIQRLELAPTTLWRRARLSITAGERVWRVDPTSEFDAGQLHDAAQLMGEIAGVPLDRQRGSLRGARITTAAVTAGGGIAAILWELLQYAPW